jgi:hypothetical protein
MNQLTAAISWVMLRLDDIKEYDNINANISDRNCPCPKSYPKATSRPPSL